MRLLTPYLVNSLINEESQRNAVDGRFSQLYGKSENRADVNSKLKDPVIGCNLISLQKEEKVIICVMGTKEECIIFLMIFLSPLTFLPFFCGLHHSSGSHQEKVGEDREQTKAVKKLDNRQQGDARKG